MLSNFKEIVKQYQSDIFPVLIVVFISLLSFGSGWLTARRQKMEPIIIRQTASIEKSVIKPIENINQGKFVGSANSNKYHHPDCSWAKKIALENQIWFNSEEDAEQAGYIKCGSFEKFLNNSN